jgi:hypothetical protein
LRVEVTVEAVAHGPDDCSGDAGFKSRNAGKSEALRIGGRIIVNP